jgi:1-acyl-sn-glycerol-3-phosphate acyltransferase
MSRRERAAAPTASLFRWCTVGVAGYTAWAVANLLFIAALPAIALVALADRKRDYASIRRFGAAFLRLFFGGYAAAIGVLRLTETPPAAAAAPGRCVFVANHTSWLDALLALALFPRVRMPVSAAYANLPLLGLIIRWMGCISLDRSSPEVLAEGLARCRRALSAGEPLFVFPEGRRGSGRGLLQFSDVFFRFAIEEDVPIVPVVMHSDVPLFTKERGSMLTSRRAMWTIRVLDALPRDRRDRASDLRVLAQRALARELRGLDG